MSFDRELKILLLGESSVGKTCILGKYKDKFFNMSTTNTVGVEFKRKQITYNNESVKLTIWDTAGTERFRTITKNFYKGANGIVLVYDVSNQSSFDKISYWFNEIKENAKDSIPFILVGNKSDLDSESRVIKYYLGKALADKYNILFFETSASKNININEMFLAIVEQAIKLESEIQERKNFSISNKDTKPIVKSNCSC